MLPDPPPELRASDADREAVVTRLQAAAHEGRLDADELEERVAAAYAAKHVRELHRLVLDVTPPPAVPAAPTPTTPRRTDGTNGLAIASLTLGVTWLWWIGSVLAIVFGHVALSQIKASGERQGGRGLAIAGLVLGYGGLALALATLVFLFV